VRYVPPRDPIGRILGVPIELDYSWFLIAIPLTWILALNYYPAESRSGTSIEFWLMAAASSQMICCWSVNAGKPT
jgi:hypothetical protein